MVKTKNKENELSLAEENLRIGCAQDQNGRRRADSLLESITYSV